MKRQLGKATGREQCKVDVGKKANGKPKRFYLGGDEVEATRRKLALNKFWKNCKAQGDTIWTTETLTVAEAIRTGQRVEIGHEQDETPEQFARREARLVKLVGDVAPIRTAATEADLHQATESLLIERIAQLEALVREQLGAGAVVGADVKVHAALDECREHILATVLDPDTKQPSGWAKAQANSVNLVKRVIQDMPLSRLNYIELEKWCRAVTARPLSLKTGKPIKRLTVRNALKVIRRFVEHASRTYGWRKPEDWHRATLVMNRRTKEERREAKAKIGNYYTLEEIGVLWRHALPVERMILLLGLNFGYAQQEIMNMIPDDVASKYVVAIRGKSEAIGKWYVWKETRELGVTEFAKVPMKRQAIAKKWEQLVERVKLSHPNFKVLSFKWLRKSGASHIRKLSDGETSSVYLSHGETASTDDDLLDIYADTDWSKVCKALRRFRLRLLPYLKAEGIKTKTYIAVSKLDEVKAGWEAGLKVEAIMKKTGVSRATAYRYKPAPALH